MIKKEESSAGEEKEIKKTYTGRDLIEETKRIIKADGIGSKLPDAALEKLAKLLSRTALKGDL